MKVFDIVGIRSGYKPCPKPFATLAEARQAMLDLDNRVIDGEPAAYFFYRIVRVEPK